MKAGIFICFPTSLQLGGFARGSSHQNPQTQRSRGCKMKNTRARPASENIKEKSKINQGTFSPAGISQHNPTKNRGRMGQAPMSRAVVLRPASSALLSRYEMCKWLCRWWQGATSINTSVSAQRICPQVRIFIKNEWVSISLHSFGSFPPKQIVALRQGCKDTQHQSRARRLDQASWVHAVLPAPPGWSR